MKEMKEILHQIAAELAELHGLLAAVAAQPCTAALALSAKSEATKQTLKSYAELLGKIEKLA
jgi:hypothetical protein